MTGGSSSFTTLLMEKPYSITDMKACMPLIHNHDNLTYDTWRELFESYCIAYGVIDHIHDSNDKAVDDPEWNRIDSIVKLWIYSTLTWPLAHKILRKNATARQVWLNLENLSIDKEATGKKERLQNINIRDSSIINYCTRIKTIADRLNNIGRPVPENDLVIYTVNGLSPKFSHIASIIRHKSPLPSFIETRSMLLLEESRLSQIVLLLKHIIMLPRIFFKARVPDDLKAAYNFQVIGEGYQVLSDPEKGEAYHKIGKSGVPNDTKIDHEAGFSLLFGSDLFEDYIGKLYMAAILEEEGLVQDMLKMEVQEMMKEFQKERETKLITILKNRLQPFLKGQTTEFVNWATAEAHQLSQAPFGEAMLHTIGYIYTIKASRELGNKLYIIPFLAEWIRDIEHQMKSHSSASQGEVELIKIQEELKKLHNSKGKEEQIMKVVEEKKDQMVNYLWQINVVDIETTLSRVCQAVLKDPTVSKDELNQRAIGMKKLGTILQGAKKHKGAQVQSPSAK